MNFKLIIAATAAVFVFASQPAFAGSQAAIQTLNPATTANHSAATPEKSAPAIMTVRRVLPANTQVRVIRRPVPGQDRAIKSVAKGRVLTTNNYANKAMKVFTPKDVRNDMPNLYRN